jgi:hypothetical protein
VMVVGEHGTDELGLPVYVSRRAPDTHIRLSNFADAAEIPRLSLFTRLCVTLLGASA